MARTLPLHRAREYETVFIVNPDVPPETLEQITKRLTGVVDRLQGKLLRVESWGRRRLAYPVRKHRKGTYVYLKYLGYSDMVHELERNMRMLEPVIKYITIRVEEEVNPVDRAAYEGEISFARILEEEHEREDAAPHGDTRRWHGEENAEEEGDFGYGSDDSGDEKRVEPASDRSDDTVSDDAVSDDEEQ